MASCWLNCYVSVGIVKYVLTIMSFIFVSHFPPQSSYPIWEDFITKASKLQSQLRLECVCVHTEQLSMFLCVL